MHPSPMGRESCGEREKPEEEEVEEEEEGRRRGEDPEEEEENGGADCGLIENEEERPLLRE